MMRDHLEHITTRGEPWDRQRLAATLPPVYREVLRKAERACCCSAKPVVVAIMPAAPGRDHATELLLCGHHYRASRRALAAAGARIFDEDGVLATPETLAPAGFR